MTQKEPDTLHHKQGSRQREDQLARVEGRIYRDYTPPQASQIQRITTQRGTDRD